VFGLRVEYWRMCFFQEIVVRDKNRARFSFLFSNNNNMLFPRTVLTVYNWTAGLNVD
jgi:hypothetical protein